MEPSASSTSGAYYPDFSALLAAAATSSTPSGAQQPPLLLKPSPFAAQPAQQPDVRVELERELQRAFYQMQALSALQNASGPRAPNPFFHAEPPSTQLPPIATKPPASSISTLHDSAATSQTALAALADTTTTGGGLPVSSTTLESLQWLQAAASMHAASGSCTPETAALLTPGRRSPGTETLDGSCTGGHTVLASAAREALAQVYAARAAPTKGVKPSVKWQREGKGRKVDTGGLQLCKVCETRKLPQHFYNRHKTCKDCQCQINRIARSQHCTRDEAKRQVNEAAFAARHGLSATAEEAGDNTTAANNALASGTFGVGCVATSGTPYRSARASPVPRDASRSPDHLRLLTEGGEHDVGVRASSTGFSFGSCGIDRLADVACAILEGGYDPTDAEPQAKRARNM